MKREVYVMGSSAESVASEVRQLAKKHRVTAERDGLSRMAVTITQLAGDTVELDGIEQLLVNLKRRGVLNKAQIMALQGRYLKEKRRFKKQLSA
ncbi:hypothetical protein [Pseudomonas sp. R1-1]|uniref:hypothetical protein n=1 Tax=Pseudomonas sp. R1-1 TaxID=1602529 RepID=UPI003DA9FF9D